MTDNRRRPSGADRRVSAWPLSTRLHDPRRGAAGPSAASRRCAGIDVDVRRGRRSGSSDPTAPGKSSTMRMVAAVSPVTGGTLPGSWGSTRRPTAPDPGADRVCPQEDTLDTEITVRENLYVYGRYSSAASGASASTSRCWSSCSSPARQRHGRRPLGRDERRLTIARSLINRPGGAARQTDDRPGPAGAHVVGPPVPAQAAGRHAGAHHPPWTRPSGSPTGWS